MIKPDPSKSGHIIQTWHKTFGAGKEQSYFRHIIQSVRQGREAGRIIYPPAAGVFNASKATKFNQVKVVILGRGPYHGAGQAHGLAFSVRPEIDIPPLPVNIYKELANDILGFHIPRHGCLQYWTKQGVLLLNTALTMRAGQAHSHAALSWEQFTDRVIAQLNEYREHIVFMLWGSHAQKKGVFIDHRRHLVLSSSHPSPLSAYHGFFDCKHFSQADAYLAAHGTAVIGWQVWTIGKTARKNFRRPLSRFSSRFNNPS